MRSVALLKSRNFYRRLEVMKALPEAAGPKTCSWLSILLAFGVSPAIGQEADSCFARTFSTDEATVLEAYVAFYGRPADPGGLAYWSDRLHEADGNLSTIMAPFANSEEFESRFGHLNNEALVANLFQQLFGREPGEEGRTFWVGELDAGRRNLESIALDILYGAQNEDAEKVSNRIVLSMHYVTGVEFGGFSGSQSPEDLAALLATLDENATSLATACQALNDTAITGGIPVVEAGENRVVTDLSAVEISGMAFDYDGSIVSYYWTQTEGPEVSLGDSSKPTISLEIPDISGDRTVSLRLDVVDNSGVTNSDSVEIFVKDRDLDQFSYDRELDPTLADAYPYISDGPYNRVLSSCVAIMNFEDSCLLSELPLLGGETENPTITDVMRRVVVSHDWMGERFAELLSLLPEDILTLLKGVTAVVIDDDVIPSYYSPVTGTLYLDAGYFWLSEQEAETITDQEDFRSDFGALLQYAQPWRYVLNNDYASNYDDFNEDGSLKLEAILYDVASLLFHELAHANDYFPPDQRDFLDPDKSVVDNAIELAGSTVSDELFQTSPLSSSLLFGLAMVKFWGADPLPYEQQLTAEQVAAEFELDFANDEYSFADVTEDVAMLFEEAMMKYHFGIDRDIAFVPFSAETELLYCSSLVVKWGRRNRLGNTDVKPRSQLVVGRILPDLELSLFFQDFPLPTEMRVNDDWCETLRLGAANAQSSSTALNRRQLLDFRTPHGRVSPRTILGMLKNRKAIRKMTPE